MSSPNPGNKNTGNSGKQTDYSVECVIRATPENVNHFNNRGKGNQFNNQGNGDHQVYNQGKNKVQVASVNTGSQRQYGQPTSAPTAAPTSAPTPAPKSKRATSENQFNNESDGNQFNNQGNGGHQLYNQGENEVNGGNEGNGGHQLYNQGEKEVNIVNEGNGGNEGNIGNEGNEGNGGHQLYNQGEKEVNIGT